MNDLLHVALSNAVAATALAVVAAVTSRLCRRPALTHSLWLLVLLKLVTPPLVTLPITWPAPVQAAASEQSQSAGQVEAAPSVDQDVGATLPAIMLGPSSLEILAAPEPGNRS